jgi:NADPH:quinone reductase
MASGPSMRAVVLEHYSGPFVLTEVDHPVAGKDQVLVRIKASGVNPLDTKIRAGKAEHAKVYLPAILGIDLAGIVEAVGPEVVGFKPGDEVYGMVGGIGGLQGTLAEFAAVEIEKIRPPRMHTIALSGMIKWVRMSLLEISFAPGLSTSSSWMQCNW